MRDEIPEFSVLTANKRIAFIAIENLYRWGTRVFPYEDVFCRILANSVE